jgi:type IV pilus assembly protein PilV
MSRKGEGGFTLIEIMVSMLVMVIGLAGVMMMQSTAVKGNRQSARFSRAALLAEELMEELRGRPVATLEATEGAAIAPLTINSVTYNRDFQVDDVPGQTGLVKVTVECTYAEEGDLTDMHTARVEMVRTRLESI